MGDKLVWNKRYEIGVEIIDKAHKKLFRILGKLFDFRQQEEKSQWVCQEAVKYFKEHFLGVCAGWLVGHALVEDQAIVSGTVGKTSARGRTSSDRRGNRQPVT